MDDLVQTDREVMVDSPEANFSGPATIMFVPNCGPRATQGHILVESHHRATNGVKHQYWVHKTHVSKLTTVN